MIEAAGTSRFVCVSSFERLKRNHVRDLALIVCHILVV
jgi:hypothetical protein